MNDSRDNEARLLAETLHDNWASGPAAGFARTAAAEARRRRKVRRALAGVGVAAIFTVAGALAWHRSQSTMLPNRETASHLVPPRAYEIISDEEFLIHLRDRPVLAVKHDSGSREFRLLANE